MWLYIACTGFWIEILGVILWHWPLTLLDPCNIVGTTIIDNLDSNQDIPAICLMILPQYIPAIISYGTYIPHIYLYRDIYEIYMSHYKQAWFPTRIFQLLSSTKRAKVTLLGEPILVTWALAIPWDVATIGWWKPETKRGQFVYGIYPPWN